MRLLLPKLKNEATTAVVLRQVKERKRKKIIVDRSKHQDFKGEELPKELAGAQ
jgi:hypothetical protein